MQSFACSRLEAQTANSNEGKEFTRDVPRLISAMAEFAVRLITLGGDTSPLSRDERWKEIFGQLDQLYEQPSGTCEKHLPKLARYLLQNPSDQPPEFISVAYVITQSLIKAEQTALKGVAEAADDKIKFQGLLIAAACAVERGDLETALKRMNDITGNILSEADLEDWTRAQVLTARLHEIRGNPSGMIETLEKLAATYRRKLGADHGRTLRWHNLLANTLYSEGKISEAEKEFSSLLKILQVKYGPHAEETKVIEKSLSYCQTAPKNTVTSPTPAMADQLEYKELLRHEQTGIDDFQAGRFEEAAREFRLVNAGKIRLRGAESLEVMMSQNNLGAVLHELGRDEDAVRLLKEVLRIREKKYPEDKISQLEVRNNLGNALRGQGKHEESVHQHRIVANEREKLLGPLHVKTIDALNNLAGGLDDVGQMEEAEKVATRVVVLRSKVQGSDHPATISSRQVLASLLSLNGKRAEARKQYFDILHTAEQALGSNHHLTLGSRRNLAYFLSQEGELEASLKQVQKAHDGSLKVLGEHNPLTRECSRLMMDVLTQLHQSQKPILVQARAELKASEKNRGSEHQKTLTLRIQLAHQLLQARQGEAAGKEYEKVIDVLKKQGFLDTVLGLEARSGMTEIQRARGEFKQAEESHRAILSQATALLGDQDAFCVECKSRLAMTLNDQGRSQEAVNLLHEVLAARRIKASGEEAEPVFATYYSLGVCLLDAKRLAEARSFASRALDGYKKIKGTDHEDTQKARQLIERFPGYGFPAPPPTFAPRDIDPDAIPDKNPFAIDAPTSLLPVDVNAPTSGAKYLR